MNAAFQTLISIFLLANWSTIVPYMHYVAFRAGDPDHGAQFRKCIMRTINGALLTTIIFQLYALDDSKMSADEISRMLYFEFPSMLSKFGIPIGFLIALMRTTGRTRFRFPKLTGDFSSSVHRIVPTTMALAASAVLFLISMKLLGFEQFIGGGLAHVKLSSWLYPHFLLASLMTAGVLGYSAYGEINGSPILLAARTCVLCAGMLTAILRLHSFAA
jgi:hypothetical protein